MNITNVAFKNKNTLVTNSDTPNYSRNAVKILREKGNNDRTDVK
jgi:hypothetical protein